MPTFKCSDIGLSCDFTSKAWTRGGLLKKIKEHAKIVHNLDPIPNDVMSKVNAAIH